MEILSITKGLQVISWHGSGDDSEPPPPEPPWSNYKGFTTLHLRNAFVCDIYISEIKVDLDFKFLKFQAKIPMSSTTWQGSVWRQRAATPLTALQ